jgi:hypothetical protein
MIIRSYVPILDECLAAIMRGETVDDCLTRYPRQAERLRPMLEIASRVGHVPAMTARPVAQAAAWNSVRLRAADLRSGKHRGVSLPTFNYGPWLRPVAIVLALFFAIGAAGSGTALAAQDSLPDSPLYRVKLATENVHLWFVFDERHEAEILLDQSAERTDEIREMVSRRKEVPGIVLSALQDRNERAAEILVEHPEATTLRNALRDRSLDQERLLVRIAAEIKDSASGDYAEALASIHNTYFVGASSFARALLPEDVAGGVLAISGVPKLVDGKWTLGGVPLGADARTIGFTDLIAGAQADFVIAIGPGGRWHALSVSKIDPGLPSIVHAEIEGEIESIEDDHIIIAGQAIPITKDTLLKLTLKKGEHVRIKMKNSEAGVVADSVSADGGAAGGDEPPLVYEGTAEISLSEATDELAVGGRSFALTELTSYDFTAGTVVAGARVKVEAAVGDHGLLEARSIAVLASDGSPDAVYLIGTLEDARPNLWVVSGLEIDPPPGNDVPPEGSVVALDARLVAGEIAPFRYTVVQSPETEDLVRVEGTVTTIDGSTWNMGFGQVRVDSRAEVAGEPQAGTRAIVWGRKHPDTGVFEAVYVRVLDQRPVTPPLEELTPES